MKKNCENCENNCDNNCECCQKMTEKRKTIYDYTPFPLKCVQRHTANDLCLVTLIYEIEDPYEQEKLMSFFDKPIT